MQFKAIVGLALLATVSADSSTAKPTNAVKTAPPDGAESRISTYLTHLTVQPTFTSFFSVLATAIPASQAESIMKNGVFLPEYATAQTWWSGLPSDARNYVSSAASKIQKLASSTSSSSNGAQETGGWKLMQGAVVGAAGAVAGMALI